MNREKFIKDKSYREGYLDGRKEGMNTTITFCQSYLNQLIGGAEELKNKLSEILENEQHLYGNNNESTSEKVIND